MKKVWLMFLFTFILSPSLAGGVRTCVPDIFSVSYGCGDGVLAGVLPTNQTVAYGAEFTVAALGAGVCTPPDGHELRGYSIIAEGKQIASLDVEGGFSFKYNYTSDIQIVPRYVQKNIASAAVIKANLGLNSDSFTYDEENKTWSVEFPYGVVSGIARCVNVWPFNLSFGYLSGYVPNDEVQEEISADLDGGRYCYCKLVSPLMDNAKWVLYHGHSEESICGALCARDCSEYAFARHGVFRSAMLVGAR